MSLARTRDALSVPNDLQSYWIPFTPNRAFKKAPRLIARAKDMHYYAADGHAVLEATNALNAQTGTLQTAVDDFLTRVAAA